ncbi:MAG: OmpA/MotB protein [Bacteroidota bacterium]|jgi:outer membrane protein OmpA-like peptidoglycan-associated protein|nr:OmpA/MotB protein [Bacteroidota bacterium]
MFLALFLYCDLAQAQKNKNLIPNPSFEEHKGKGADIKAAVPWKGVGTVDYYLKPEKRDTSKYKGARTGTAYVGLRFQADYKEYMHVKLLEPLERGQVYHFKMYIRLLESSNVTVTIKQLGAYFSDYEFKVGMIFEEDGLVDTTYNKGISGTLNWITIQGDYRAHGGEKYVIIGNFRTKMKEDFVKKNKWSLFEFKEAYYYLDDISLRKKSVPFDSVAVFKDKIKNALPVFPDIFNTGQKVKIEKIEFVKGTDEFTQASYKFLDHLVNTLNQHPFMEIEIVGHVYTGEGEGADKRLSKQRAKAIFEYLKSQDVINPMTYKGVGNEEPLAPNDTDENKANNNRMEFVVIKE